MSWFIPGVILYCSSLIIAGLVPESLLESNASDISLQTSTISSTTKKFDIKDCIEDECNQRLKSNLEVHSYELVYIYNNTNDTTVQGHVTINFILKEPINQLIYHAKRMVHLDEPILYEDGINLPVTMRQYAPNDYVSLSLKSNNSSFPPNRYVLKQNFIVSLIDGSVGFYQSTFKNGNGTRGYMNIFLINVLKVYFYLENY
jgi:hypothetical protein